MPPSVTPELPAPPTPALASPPLPTATAPLTATASTTVSPTVWFHFPASAQAHWVLVPDPADPWRLTIRHRDPPAAGTTVHQVVILFAKESPVYEPATATILDIFESRKIEAVFTLINFRSDAARGRQALAAAPALHAELIFAMGSDTTDFTTGAYKGGAIPVVSVLSKDPVLLGQMPDYEHGSGTNLAFTSVNVPIEVQMAYLLELRPELRNILVLYDKDNKSAIQTQVNPLKVAAAAQKIQVFDVVANSPASARADLESQLPAQIAAAQQSDPDESKTICWITGSTATIQQIATINRLADHVPVLSVFPDLVQAGDDSALLSIGVSFDSAAHLAASYGARILLGEVRAGDLQVGTISPPDIAINFRKAREIGLKIPFRFFESASFIYDYAGKPVRVAGQPVGP
jgi:putative ABC transport system substrate-binding protein